LTKRFHKCKKCDEEAKAKAEDDNE